MREGLYSVHVRLGDGRDGKGSGVLVFQGGQIRGGDAFLFYVGSYEVRGGTVVGEVVVNQHTPSPGRAPVFGGREVGIGFSGPWTDAGATFHGTALVGRESVAFYATLQRLGTAPGATPGDA